MRKQDQNSAGGPHFIIPLLCPITEIQIRYVYKMLRVIGYQSKVMAPAESRSKNIRIFYGYPLAP
jgi:hypothetical protein